MTTLTIFSDTDSIQPLWQSESVEEIQRKLNEYGVYFSRWPIQKNLVSTADHTEVAQAYQPVIEQLIAENGYQSWDLISIQPEHPQKEQLRQKFLAEHTHGEDEVRFFVEGSGLFCVHINDEVLQILCKKGDCLAVPAGIPHWFDMGSTPFFTAIRLFNNPEGWVAAFTGSTISEAYPQLT